LTTQPISKEKSKESGKSINTEYLRSDAVCEHVGLPMTQKTAQRKFLLMQRPENIPVKYEEFEQQQTYLDVSKLENEDLDGFAFIRRRGQNGVNSYTYSIRRVKDGKSAILERQISGREYKNLMKIASHDRATVKKNVRCFTYNNQYFQIVEFIEPTNNIFILTTNSNGNAKIEIPPWIEALQEVTQDQTFESFHIASFDHQK
jgi:hypothetical protein